MNIQIQTILKKKITSILILNNGTIALYKEITIFIYNPITFQLINEIKLNKKQHTIFYLTQFSDNSLIITGKHFIYIYNYQSENSYKKFQYIFLKNKGEIIKALELKNKNLLICGCFGFEIYKKNIEKNNQYYFIYKLETNWILNILEFKENEFLLAQDRKLSIFKDEKFNVCLVNEDFIFFIRNRGIILINNDFVFINGKQYLYLFSLKINDIWKKIKIGNENIHSCIIQLKNKNEFLLGKNKILYIIKFNENKKIFTIEKEKKLNIEFNIQEFEIFDNYKHLIISNSENLYDLEFL